MSHHASVLTLEASTPALIRRPKLKLLMMTTMCTRRYVKAYLMTLVEVLSNYDLVLVWKDECQTSKNCRISRLYNLVKSQRKPIGLEDLNSHLKATESRQILIMGDHKILQEMTQKYPRLTHRLSRTIIINLSTIDPIRSCLTQFTCYLPHHDKHPEMSADYLQALLQRRSQQQYGGYLWTDPMDSKIGWLVGKKTTDRVRTRLERSYHVTEKSISDYPLWELIYLGLSQNWSLLNKKLRGFTLSCFQHLELQSDPVSFKRLLLLIDLFHSDRRSSMMPVLGNYALKNDLIRMTKGIKTEEPAEHSSRVSCQLTGMTNLDLIGYDHFLLIPLTAHPRRQSKIKPVSSLLFHYCETCPYLERILVPYRKKTLVPLWTDTPSEEELNRGLCLMTAKRSYEQTLLQAIMIMKEMIQLRSNPWHERLIRNQFRSIAHLWHSCRIHSQRPTLTHLGKLILLQALRFTDPDSVAETELAISYHKLLDFSIRKLPQEDRCRINFLSLEFEDLDTVIDQVTKGKSFSGSRCSRRHRVTEIKKKIDEAEIRSIKFPYEELETTLERTPYQIAIKLDQVSSRLFESMIDSFVWIEENLSLDELSEAIFGRSIENEEDVIEFIDHAIHEFVEMMVPKRQLNLPRI